MTAERRLEAVSWAASDSLPANTAREAVIRVLTRPNTKKPPAAAAERSERCADGARSVRRWLRSGLPSVHPLQCRGIRTIRKSVPPVSRFNAALEPLRASPAAARARRTASDTLPLRTGALATKKGMSALYDMVTGKRTPVTVLQMDRVQVVGHKTREKNGYFAVCVGQGWRNAKNVHNAQLGQYAKAVYENESGTTMGLSPKRDVREFHVRDKTGLLPIGSMIGPTWFTEGQYVDTRSNSKGHGFTGVMKRWNMGGQPASHGVSLVHRSLGSAGGSQGSGSRVIPGKKMAGRMGNERHTVQNLKILQIDEDSGLIIVNGCVSGPKGALVQVQDALKKPWPDVAPIPPSAQEAAEPLRQTV
ncbi:MAG: hypothetical protein Q9159_006201 [Coniocarpon cinnabarinum]